MKDYIDRLSNARNDAERRQITRDQLGMQDMNWGSFIGGWVAGALISRGIGEMLSGGGRRRGYDPYDDFDNYGPYGY